MSPTIGRSIGEGFRVANRSWAGMAVYAGGWVVVGLVMVLLLMATGAIAPIPEELTREMARAEQAGAPAPTVPVLQATTTTDAPAEDEEASATTASAPVAPSPEVKAPAMTQEQVGSLVLGWLGRAWPLVALIVAVFLAAAGFLYGGQLGYLAKRVREGAAPVSEIWRAGARAVGPLVAGSLLSLLAAVGFAVVIGLITWLASLLPQVPGIVLGVLAVLAVTVALIWALVAVTFWFMAIVADRLGPVGGLRASLRTVRGRWWRTCGLVACLLLIALAMALPLGIVEGIGKAVGGIGGGVLVALSSVLQLLVVNLYFGFVFSAAALRYYEDAKTA